MEITLTTQPANDSFSFCLQKLSLKLKSRIPLKLSILEAQMS